MLHRADKKADGVTASLLRDEIAALEALTKAAGDDDGSIDRRISLARGRWPDDLRLRLIEGGWLEKTGRVEEAVAVFQTARDNHPANPWPAVRLVELFLRRQRPDDARMLFREAVWTGSAPEQTRTGLLSRILMTLVDPDIRRAYLETLLRSHPDDRFILLKLAAIRFRQQDRSGTEALFDKARAWGPLTDESRLIELELHLAAARFEDAYALSVQLMERNPDRVEFARRAIQAAIFTGRIDSVIALLDAALTRWPDDWLLLFRYNRCPLSDSVDKRLFALLRARAPEQASNSRWLFQYAIAALRHDAVADARAIIDRLATQDAVAHMAGPLQTAMAAHPAATWDNRRAVRHGCDLDVQMLPMAGARATILLFASVVGGLGYLPFGLADGLLRQRPVNILYLRDRNHRSFTSGIASLGPDHDAMIEALRRMADELGVPVITMGSSIAGVAAIRCAAMMESHAAISFAGPINLGLDAAEDAPVAANGTRASLFSTFTSADMDLVGLIRSVPQTHVHQVFGAAHAPDAEAARCLDGLHNVTLYPITDCADHFAIEHAIANGLFFAVLDKALATIGGGI